MGVTIAAAMAACACSDDSSGGEPSGGSGGGGSGGIASDGAGASGGSGGTTGGTGAIGNEDAGTDGDAGAGGQAGTGGPIFDGDADSGEILVLTYNVAGLPAALTGSPDPEARMPLISPLLNDYDLVITQEDWQTPDPNPFAPNRVYHELLDDYATHPYQSIPLPLPLGADPNYWPATQNRPAIAALVSDGLNEFSRVYFDRSATTHVTWNDCYGDATVGAADCLSTKGFTVTTHLLASGVEVDVYNLHGEAGRGTEDLRLLRADFEQQLAAYITDPARTGRAIILGGDTNLHTERNISASSPDREIWQNFLAATGLVDVCDTSTTGITCSPNRDGNFIDKIAYRSSSTLLIEALSHSYETDKFTYTGGYLSDHDPLAVRLRWSRQ